MFPLSFLEDEERMIVMSLIQKNILSTSTVLIFIISLICLNNTYADNIFPLEDGEKLLEERIIDEHNAEVFTEYEGDFYLKILKKDEDNWIVENAEIIHPRWTGLEINETNEIGDRSLSNALEKKLRKYGMEASSLPEVVDYSDSECLPPIGTQYEDSCVGWSTGYYLRTYQQAKDIGWAVKEDGNGIDSHIFSPTFIYNQINNGVDSGAYIEDAAELLAATGAAVLKDFPYVPGDYYTQPNKEVLENASTHKIKEWKILYTENDSAEYIIQKTKEYLNTGDLIVAGGKIGFKFLYPYVDQAGNSVINTENYPSYKHAYVIVGYDDTLTTFDGIGAFKIVNSWGEEWGNDGFSYISYEAYAANVLEGFVFTDLLNGNIVEDIEEIDYEIISPTQISFTWGEAANAEGYIILDEALNEITRIDTNRFTVVVNNPSEVKRYVQAFNSISTSTPTAISIDTSNITKEELQLDIQDSVIFNIDFSGKCKFDIAIYDNNDEPILQENNLQGSQGSNTITWNGCDMEGAKMEDGSYSLKVITYTNGTQNPSFDYPFNKAGKIEAASCKAAIYDNSIQYVEIPLSFRADGTLNINLVYNNETYDIVSNQAVQAGESKIYKILKRIFNFNDKALDNITLQIDVQ